MHTSSQYTIIFWVKAKEDCFPMHWSKWLRKYLIWFTLTWSYNLSLSPPPTWNQSPVCTRDSDTNISSWSFIWRTGGSPPSKMQHARKRSPGGFCKRGVVGRESAWHLECTPKDISYREKHIWKPGSGNRFYWNYPHPRTPCWSFECSQWWLFWSALSIIFPCLHPPRYPFRSSQRSKAKDLKPPSASQQDVLLQVPVAHVFSPPFPQSSGHSGHSQGLGVVVSDCCTVRGTCWWADILTCNPQGDDF